MCVFAGIHVYLCVLYLCMPDCGCACVLTWVSQCSSMTGTLCRDLRIVPPQKKGCATLSAFWVKLNRKQDTGCRPLWILQRIHSSTTQNRHLTLRKVTWVSSRKLLALNVYHQCHTVYSWRFQLCQWALLFWAYWVTSAFWGWEKSTFFSHTFPNHLGELQQQFKSHLKLKQKLVIVKHINKLTKLLTFTV